jgi:hypothetical protein
MKRNVILFLMLMMGLQFSNSAHAWNWIHQFYGDGCKARWNSCMGWVKKNCGESVGGCNGSCVFGISGDCEPDDFQLSQLQSSDSAASAGGGRNTYGVRNQRKKAPSSLKYTDMLRDPSAVQGKSYQAVERGGRVINKTLNDIEAKQLGVRLELEPIGKPNRINPVERSY